MSGIVHLVGAGPGDPGLLTVAGRRALEEAEVVVHDRLGTEELLPLCRPDAELIDAGKAPGRAALTQEQINAVLVERGAAGRRVVRLKGGDPFVFGRGGEEAQALTAADVPYVVVPGVTSAIAAPAYAGIPITHRGVATAFTVVTGHEDPDKPSEQTDWAALAATGGTLSILMGMGRLGGIAEALIAGGRAPDEPAAAVQWGTTPRQRSVVATLSTLADRVREAGLGSPAVVVVGPVAALAPEIGWREGPLLGRTVVVTRARAQASGLSERAQPLDETPEDAAMVAGIGSYGMLVLTSVNGVDALFDRLGRLGRDARAIPEGAVVVAIGPVTSATAREEGLEVHAEAREHTIPGLVDALLEDAGR